MAFNFLRSLLSSLNKGQAAALDDIVRTDRESANEFIAKQDYSELVKAIEGASSYQSPFVAEPVFVPDGETVEVSSKHLNKTIAMIYMALKGLYEQHIRADVTLQKHAEINNSRLNTVKSGINKISEDIATYLQSLDPDNGDYTNVIYGDFWSLRNEARTRPLLEVDSRAKTLHLPTIDKVPAHKLEGSQASKITTKNLALEQTPGVISADFRPENAIDDRNSTYWLDVSLADSALNSTVNIGGTSITYPGVAVQYTTDFRGSVRVSHVQLTPFSQFPLQLVGLEYWQGDEDNGSWTAISSFSRPAAGDASTATLDTIDVRFAPVVAARIRVTLLQRHYAFNDYLIPRGQIDNVDLWSQMLDEELNIFGNDTDFTDEQLAFVNENGRYRSFYRALEKVADSAISLPSGLEDLDQASNIRRRVDAVLKEITSLDPSTGESIKNLIPGKSELQEKDPEELVEFRKYEYQIGIADLGIFQERYASYGIWESPEYSPAGLPFEIDLETDESYITENSVRTGSIEYELEFAPNRIRPIHPAGASTNEVLKFAKEQGVMVARLRFTATSAVSTVYESGQTFSSGKYTGTTTTVTIDDIDDFNPAAIYTATYTPATASLTVDLDTEFNSEQLTTPEIFDGTDKNGALKLSYYPYVAREIVWATELPSGAAWHKPHKREAFWEKDPTASSETIDGVTYAAGSDLSYEPIEVMVNGVKARNITDYTKNIQPAFVQAGESTVEYIHFGRNLFFNQPITGTISVNYKWLVRYVKLRAKMLGHKYNNLTSPTLNNYKIKIKASTIL